MSEPFPETRWTVIARAQSGGEPTVARALEELCSAYWKPVFRYVLAVSGSYHESQDLTQGFFADLLNRDFLSNVSKDNGKFRSFLLASVKNFLSKERRRASAVKRGGRVIKLSLDFADFESNFLEGSGEAISPDLAFERQWVLSVLERVLGNLESEYQEMGRGELFGALRNRLTGEGPEEDYSLLAGGLGMTEGAVKVALHRLRKRYRQSLKAEIQRTLGDGQDVEEELAYLMRVFSNKTAVTR